MRAPCVWILFLVFPPLKTSKQGFGRFILLYSLKMLQIDLGTILQANQTLLLVLDYCYSDYVNLASPEII